VEEMINIYKVLIEGPEGEGPLELGVDGRIILELILCM
jgi:hypothetical protein